MFLSGISRCPESVPNTTMAKNTIEHSLRHLHFTQRKSIGDKAKCAEILLIVKIHTAIFRVSTFRVKVTMESYVPLKLWKKLTRNLRRMYSVVLREVGRFHSGVLSDI